MDRTIHAFLERTTYDPYNYICSCFRWIQRADVHSKHACATAAYTSCRIGRRPLTPRLHPRGAVFSKMPTGKSYPDTCRSASEHPLPLMRSLVPVLDNLSKSGEFRVNDLAGIGIFVLIQHGETFYLLASRSDKLRLRTSKGFQSPAVGGMLGVTELPFETATAQKELFSKDLREFLVLYRIQSQNLDKERERESRHCFGW